MTKTEVLDLLKENRDARGEANWKEMGDRTGGLTSFGIGLTELVRLRNKLGATTTLRSNFGTNGPTSKDVGLSSTTKTTETDQVERRSTARGQECSATCSADAMRPSPSPSRSRSQGLDGEQRPRPTQLRLRTRIRAGQRQEGQAAHRRVLSRLRQEIGNTIAKRRTGCALHGRRAHEHRQAQQEAKHRCDQARKSNRPIDFETGTSSASR